MKEFISNYKKTLTPPYTKKDRPIIGLSLVFLIVLVFSILSISGAFRTFSKNRASVQAQSTNAQEFISDEILIRFKPGVKKSHADKTLKLHNLTIKKEIPKIGVKVLKVSPQARDNVIRALAKNPATDFVEANGIVKVIQAPSAPGTLVAKAISSTAIALSWGASADDGSVGTYTIFKDGQSIVSGNVLHHTVKNLTPNTTYQFFIRATDNLSNLSPNSNIVTVTTLSSDPPTDPSCVINAPSGGITPYNQIGTSGQTFTFSLTIRNNDTGACPISYFYFSESPPPSGWSNPTGNIVALSPGESLTIPYSIVANPLAIPKTYSMVEWIFNALDNSKYVNYGFSVTIDSPLVPTPTSTPSATITPTTILNVTPGPTIPFSGTPNDPYFSQQWGLVKIKAVQAWDISKSLSSVKVAVLDTGVDQGHQDLGGKVISSMNFTTSSTPFDIRGHGSHVSGVISAITNNSTGVASVGINPSIINVKVLDDYGNGTWDGVASGIVWAADNGANIINLSLGSNGTTVAVESAVNYAWNKGVLVVTAAGNNGNSIPFYPAYYSNSIAVAATDVSDLLASFSNRGDWVDVAAPGVNILSTIPGNQYQSWNGTSMASPHVAGLGALLWTKVVDINSDGYINDEVRNCIQNNADNIGISGIGSGRINALNAVNCALPTTPPPDTQSPTASITFPFSGATVSGEISVNVDAVDNIEVAKVDLYLDGILYATDDLNPYSFFLDTTTLTNTNHNLVARATDSSSNIGVSTTINFVVNNIPPTPTPTSTPIPTNTPTPIPTSTPIPTPTPDLIPPQVQITSPINGAIVTKNKTTIISASATDNVGVTNVEFYANSLFLCRDTAAPYTCSWRVPRPGSVTYSLQAIAHDAAGKVSYSQIVRVTSSK